LAILTNLPHTASRGLELIVESQAHVKVSGRVSSQRLRSAPVNR